MTLLSFLLRFQRSDFSKANIRCHQVRFQGPPRSYRWSRNMSWSYTATEPSSPHTRMHSYRPSYKLEMGKLWFMTPSSQHSCSTSYKNLRSRCDQCNQNSTACPRTRAESDRPCLSVMIRDRSKYVRFQWPTDLGKKICTTRRLWGPWCCWHLQSQL